MALANELATEHLHLAGPEAERLADRIRYAGAIFLGAYTPVPVGDYAAGPSHVLADRRAPPASPAASRRTTSCAPIA